MDENVYIVIHLESAFQRYICIYKKMNLFIYIYMVLKQHSSSTSGWGKKYIYFIPILPVSILFLEKESFISFCFSSGVFIWGHTFK